MAQSSWLILMRFSVEVSGGEGKGSFVTWKVSKASPICREQRVIEDRMLVWEGRSLFLASQVKQSNPDDQQKRQMSKPKQPHIQKGSGVLLFQTIIAIGLALIFL